MVTRISTTANVDAIVQRMLDQQTRVNDLQQQVATGVKSQDYVGVSSDAQRLLSIENEIGRVQNYLNNNGAVSTTLNVQLSAAQGIDTAARNMRSELLTFAGHDLSSGSPITQTQVQDIQEKAFNALSQIAFFLNQKVDGKYVFGGGRSDTPPINFPYDSLSQFQQTYDGIGKVFPSSRVANLVDISFPNVSVNYQSVTVGGNPYNEVSAGAGSFITQNLTTSAFGTLVFTNVGANGKITATTPGAFKSLQVGQTFLLNNTDPGQGGATANNGVYTITAVSPDGNTITLDQNVNAGTEPAGSVNIGLTVPNGTTLALSGSSNGNNGAYTVKWPTNAELAAAGYNLSGGQVADGSILLTNPPVVSATSETVSLDSTAFMQGSSLTTFQKISDTQSIKLDVTGLDPAFEKLIRGLGVLAQGDLIKNPTRAQDALTFVNDAIEHSSLQPTEERSDLQSVQDRISLNLKQLKDMHDQQTEFLTFLQNRRGDIINADPTETAVRLNAESNSLQVSYATLARIQKLSLLNYI
jgi:flagellin-like hook-associated protein FlgL